MIAEKTTKKDLLAMIDVLIDENNEYELRIKNLELYLEFLRIEAPSAWKKLRKQFPGLPGHIVIPVKKKKPEELKNEG